ncbi:hypothetical protein FDP25_02690 [Roseovarius sp. A21]|uniref:NADH dehydrogenase subunit E n=1 Tax=Roseovarius bejariae TaxID=2576383 RepID=A0A844CUG7_9RHOB|nr:DUF5333 domain-containing protein [Roseovarius bejariae]MRU14330.1 hypothetical protein [Roseovarius bejariae]
MRMMTTLVLSATLASAAIAGSASTKPGLPREADINNGLLAVAAADKIRRECDSISGRFWRARSYLNGLKDLASERGYTDDEIDAYINDDAEQDKMRAKRNAYFKSKGASNLDPDSLCVLGREEIRKNSQIGSLLRAK